MSCCCCTCYILKGIFSTLPLDQIPACCWMNGGLVLLEPQMLSVCLPLLHPPRNIMVWGGVTTNFIFYFCSHLFFFLNCCCFIFPLRALLVFQLWSGSAVLSKTRFLSNMCRVRQEVRLKTHTFGFFFVTGSEVCSKPTNTQHVD